MPDFAALRRLAPPFALLCLLSLSPLSQAQTAPKLTAPMPTAPVQKLADQANVLEQAGKHEEALRLYNDALTQARTSKDADGEALLLRKIGNVYFSMGQFPKALEFYQQALPIARFVGDKLAEVATLTNLGSLYRNTGQVQKAVELFEQVPLLYRQLGDKNGEANALADLGNVYRMIGQTQKSVGAYIQSLPLYRQTADKNGEAWALANVSVSYKMLGQPQKALETLEMAILLVRQLKDKGAELHFLNDLVSFYWETNQTQKALETLDQALAMYRALGDKNKEASTLSTLGSLYRNTGQAQKAVELFEQVPPLYRQLGDKNGEANALGDLGYAYQLTGQPQRAVALYIQSLPLYRQAANKGGEANALCNASISYRNLSQIQKALEAAEKALLLFRQLGDDNGEAFLLTDLGSIYRDTGQPQKAVELFEQAVPVYKKFGDKNREADALTDLGYAYWVIGRSERAIESYMQSLPLYRQTANKSGESRALINVCISYKDLGQPQKVSEFFEQALLLIRQVGDKGAESHFLTDFSSFYQDTGQRQKALEAYGQALLQSRRAGDDNREAHLLNDLGWVYRETNQRQKAVEVLEQAVTLCRRIGDKGLEAETLDAISDDEEHLSFPLQALTHAEQAVVAVEQYRADVNSQGDGRYAFLNSRLHVYRHCLNLLCRQGNIAQAFALAQKTKARSLLDLLASSQVDLDAALTPQERRELQGSRQQAQQLNAQMLKEGVENEVGAKKRFAALQEQLKHNEGQLQLLMDRLYALHPGLADQQQARTARLSDMAPLLPADTALLEYVQTSDKELLLFVVTTQNGKAQVHLHTLALPAAQLQRQCADFHAACADPRKDPAALSTFLSRLLLTPAQTALRGKTRLIICPDGPLWDVPFAALRVPGQPAQHLTRNTKPAYLWERCEISYAYSATGMQAALAACVHRKPAEHASVLALANPFFGSSSRFGDIDGVPGQRPFELPSRPFEVPSRPFELPSRPFAPPSRPVELPSRQLMAAVGTDRGKAIRSLPGAQREAEAIRRLFPDAAIYTGKAAQESVVIREAGKYKYLHFATHGFYNDAAPLLSCIVLAQPQRADKVGNTQNTGNTQHANSAAGAKENTAAVVVPVAALTADAPPADTLVTNAPFAAAQTQAEDGLLTARKVFGLHLSADLVTLSACNSGRGQVRTGEGIVGLTWAFFAAGCPAQVVSQWSVDDAATGQLMATFYAGLKQGKSKSAALRDAALKLSKDGKHRHPYYWTPFFLVGDWR